MAILKKLFEMLFWSDDETAATSREKPPAVTLQVPPPQHKSYPLGLVGESFYQPAIKRCKVGSRVYLFTEPSNPHDPKAIVVESEVGDTIGYLPRDSFVHRLVHSERKGCSGRILSINGGDGPKQKLGIVLELTLDGSVLRERPYRRG